MSAAATLKRGGSNPIIAIIALNLALGIYSVAAADYLRDRAPSVDVATGLILFWVALVGLLSYIEATVIQKLVVRGGWRGSQEIRQTREDLLRPLKDLHLPLTIAIVTLLGLNLLIFDRIAGGFFVDEQRANHVITRLRSDNEALKREAILAASKMHEVRVREELVRFLDEPDTARALAAWALGKAGTPSEAPALVELLRNGNTEERGASAVALGRLGYDQLTSELATRLRGPDEPIESYLVALGWLGDRHATLPIMEMMLDERTAPDHLALGAWALGQIRDQRACPILVRATGPEANPLTCAATTALWRLGCEGEGSALIRAFETSGMSDRCEPVHFIDLDGRPIQLWPAKLYRVALLHALADSRDAEVEPWLERLSRDASQVPQVRDTVSRMREDK